MATVGRLQGGDLLLTGELTERTPTIDNGLIAKYPFDGISVGQGGKNILDYSVWQVGSSGNQGNFYINGTTSENTIILKNNPFGYEDAIWASTGNDSTSDADGGWNNYGHSIDNTKKYRLSVWILREDVGDGRTYFGTEANQVCNLGTTTKNGNPYFGSRLISDVPEMENNWILWVAYIHPHDYTGGTDSTSGLYMTDGRKVSSLGDYKWASDATNGEHRTYLYYSTTTTEKQFWYRPRFEVCDGSESSLDDLIKGNDEAIHPTTDSNTSKTYDGVAVEKAITNYLTDGVSGYTALNPSHWNGATLSEVGKTDDGYPIIEYNTSGTSYAYTHDYILDDDLTTLSGKVVTFSLYIRRKEGSATGQIRVYDNVSGYSYQSVNVTTEFQKFQMTKSIGSSPTRIFVMIDNTGGGTYEFHSPQLEQGSFATSFSVDYRGAGKLYYPLSFAQNDNFTINIKAKYNSGNGELDIFCDDTNRWNGQLRVSSSSSTLELLLRDLSGTTYNKYTSSLYTPDDGNWHTYTLVSESGYGVRLYYDGSNVANWSGLYPTYSHLSVGRNGMGDANVRGGIYKDLSVYNRVLSADEISKLHSNKMSIKSDGKLISDKIIESANVGSGKDGGLTVATVDRVVNDYGYITADILKGSKEITLESIPANLSVEDEILIIQMQDGVGIGGASNHEFNIVKSIDSGLNKITLLKPLKRDYGSGTPNQINSSVSQIVRIPHYSSITINSTYSLTCQEWNGKTGGILSLRCQGSITNSGKIHVNGKGYRGGRASGVSYYGLGTYSDAHTDGECGEGYTGLGRSGFYSGETPVEKDGGGTTYVGGSGGSYGTKGQNGTSYGGYQPLAGLVYGDDLIKPELYLGSGGGAGHNNSGFPMGGRGAGIIAIYSDSINGVIESNGQDAWYYNNDPGLWGAGGGSGGSIYVESNTDNSSKSSNGGLKANGNAGRTDGQGGNGGNGVIRVWNRDILSIPMRSSDKTMIQGEIKEDSLL